MAASSASRSYRSRSICAREVIPPGVVESERDADPRLTIVVREAVCCRLRACVEGALDMRLCYRADCGV
jgi:hypothetical protein